MNQTERILLASSSATRAAMLESAGIIFDTAAPLIGEKTLKWQLRDVSRYEIAARLAESKSLSLAQKYPDRLIIGSDQTLILADGLIDKCSEMTDVRQTLRALRGRSHILRSAVSVSKNAKLLWTHYGDAVLTMREFSEEFLDAYIKLEGDALLTTVGAYRIEGRGIQLFESVSGDHHVILGMPLLPLLGFLRSQGAIGT